MGATGRRIVGLAALLAALSAPPGGAAELSLEAALTQALKSNPNTLLRQQQVAAAGGQLMQAQGAFDTVLGASVERRRDLRPLRADEVAAFQAAGLDPGRTQIQQGTSYRLGADRRLMNGVSAGLGFSVDANADNLQQSFGVPRQLAGTLRFTLRLPLARNAGRATVGAEVDARQSEVELFRADLHHGNAQLVLDTTLAYWDWLAKSRRLEIAAAGEQRLGDLSEEMRRLIEAGQMPRADLELVLASRAEKAAQRLSAEQAVHEARRVLARLLGLPAENMRAIGTPQDDFPVYQDVDAELREAELVRDALALRADLEAGRYREQAAHYRLSAARNNLKPQVDLNLSVGYTGLAEGASAPRVDRSLELAAGPSLGASVSVQWPWENAAARGVQRVAGADYDSASIRRRDLEDAVAIAIPVAVAALRRAVGQGRAGEEAVRRYETTLKNERTKRRLGNATVIDVINVEDRLNNALLANVALRQDYANAVARLRFELGRLVRRDGEEYRVALGALLSGRVLSE